MIGMRHIVFAGAILAAVPAVALDLPSGITAELREVLLDEVAGQDWVRFRITAPEIDKSLIKAPTFEDIEQDFGFVCRQVALPYIDQYTLTVDLIAISISDRFVEFGATDPDATQYFEVFRSENGDCIWEGF